MSTEILIDGRWHSTEQTSAGPYDWVEHAQKVSAALRAAESKRSRIESAMDDIDELVYMAEPGDDCRQLRNKLRHLGTALLTLDREIAQLKDEQYALRYRVDR